MRSPRARRTLVLSLAASALLGCGDSTTRPAPTAGLTLTPVITSGLSNPLFLASPPNDARLFIVEKGGRIRIFANGALAPTPFLDLTDRVATSGEQGLLSIAFHPGFAANGLFFVYFANTAGDIRVVRYHATGDVADAASGDTILAIPHPGQTNHYGGLLAFGPDGKLYIGTGDGGGSGDPPGNAQNTGVLLGKLLRLDVDGALPYAIPDGNPFKGVAGKRAEIWDYGLRNPWRYAFDRTTGRLYIGDVGQSAWEEVDVEEPGAGGVNYGWNIMEGMHCYGSSSCDQTGLVLPKYEYGHGEGCAIVGGYVYRGTRIPGVVGQYFFSDLCSGFLRSFTYAGGAATNVTTWNVGSIGQPWSFGEDNDGELYIVTGGGTVYRIDPPPASGQ